jgi:DNA polymerase IV (DinB-like DNA polymerase)
MSRIILHCDLDCFFAAVEVRDNPDYEGKPVIIGADPKEGKGRGVISTCSYEARKFGLHSAMPITRAYRLCPHGIYLRPDGKKYSKVSTDVMLILKKYSNKFQQVGIDEAYLDVSETCSTFKEARNLADKIRNEVFSKVGVTISIGCAPTKSIAKIASDYRKPNGTTCIDKNHILEFLKPMDITRISGIGKKSKIYYNKKGIKTIGDIISTPLEKMLRLFGKNGKWVWNVAHGLDNREVSEFPSFRKSISKERTFHEDTSDLSAILTKLEEINDKIHTYLEKNNVFYKTISLKIRFNGFETFTRAKTLSIPIRDKKHALKVVLDLFKEFSSLKRKVRLVGIRFSNLEKNPREKQYTLLKFVSQSC